MHQPLLFGTDVYGETNLTRGAGKIIVVDIVSIFIVYGLYCSYALSIHEPALTAK